MFITNADDFGLSKLINDRIIVAIEKGEINAASIIVNTSFSEEAISFARTKPSFDWGIHLNCCEGAPILPLKSLIGGNGLFFAGYKNFTLRYLLGKVDLKDIEKEFSAQIALLQNAGVSIGHCDSHQYLHLFPSILNIVIKLCKNNKISRIRLVNEPISFCGGYRFLSLLFLKLLSWFAASKLRRFSIGFAEYYYGYADKDHLSPKTLKKALNKSRIGFVEVVFHFAESHG